MKCTYHCYSQAQWVFLGSANMRLHSQVMEILTLNARYIIALLENGRCSIHDKGKINI